MAVSAGAAPSCGISLPAFAQGAVPGGCFLDAGQEGQAFLLFSELAPRASGRVPLLWTTQDCRGPPAAPDAAALPWGSLTLSVCLQRRWSAQLRSAKALWGPQHSPENWKT